MFNCFCLWFVFVNLNNFVFATGGQKIYDLSLSSVKRDGNVMGIFLYFLTVYRLNDKNNKN